MKRDDERTCPSTAAAPGVSLLGIVGEDGRIGYISPPVPVDEALLDRLGTTGLEKRFRFSGTCVEGGCPNWTGKRCGVIDELVAEIPAQTNALPRCTIRKTCRWFAQAGAEACYRCPVLITDTRPERDFEVKK